MLKMRVVARSIVALAVAGHLASWAAMAVEAVGGLALGGWPDPPVVAAVPPEVLAVGLLAIFVGVFVGSWITARLARISPHLHAWLFGGINGVVIFFGLLLQPFSSWMWIATVTSVSVAIWLGGALAARQLQALPPDLEPAA